MEDITKTIMFTSPLQNGQQATIQYQTADGTILKTPKVEGQKAQDFPAFYTTSNGGTVSLTQITTEDNKICYIAQPNNYNSFVLANQLQVNANSGAVNIATIDNHGRLVAMNKQPSVNTISSISYKCDVCGLMFAHLTALNQHKRTHIQTTEIGPDGQTHQVITVDPQNILQAQSIVNENGQSLGQIQILTTESLEPASGISQMQTSNASNEVTVTTSKSGMEKAKCMSCGLQMLVSGKRKKNFKCDNCIHTENQEVVEHQSTAAPSQIYISSEGEVKFELNELPSGSESSMDSMSQTVVLHPHDIESTEQPTMIKKNCVHGHHPVKKRNQSHVTKCQKCNGTGIIYIGNSKACAVEVPKPFTCNICGGTFSRYSSLWSHKKLHSGEKNYKCNICGLAFAKAVYLKNHARIHTGEKPYKCQTCGMQFSQSPHLKNHERTHSGEKPYVCEVCDKGFARHATLWNHRRIHTGEKPYKCSICSSAFSQAAHLKNHAKVHSGEKPHKCDICSAAFGDRFALKRHRGIHEKYGEFSFY
ncbi:hypothetical protein ACFFRR_008163 [Megaselia abdita]